MMMVDMRTTLTLEPDVTRALENEIRRSGQGMKAVVNEALRRGLGLAGELPAPKPFVVKATSLGMRPGIDRDKLTQLVDELEVEEWLAKQGR